MMLRIRSDTTKDIEILVLRQQLAVLQSRTPRTRLCWADRALTAALVRLLPARRRRGLIVIPSTILRWHRQLLTRRWTAPPVRRGRPAIPAGVRTLILRLATENPTWGYCAPNMTHTRGNRAVVIGHRLVTHAAERAGIGRHHLTALRRVCPAQEGFGGTRQHGRARFTAFSK
jgi:hypothetical protein